ncbi:MAG: response regulator [Dehalococcoidia bacterium]|nr:response regulator [Dehalococcoidia bacterium]MCA9856898.1 response regulator [Dehalococcoidia bacterium]MCB9483740.1 response regulator [Dehalococcoidia bacterium]MCB9491339.1 response regulator [Dehalococcoidia bacterium]
MTRILIVEDDAAIRRLAHDLLVDEGFEVFLAETGEDGLAALGEHEPNLVLLDLMMPLMDGPTFATEMERRQHDVPIVVLSGSRDIHEIASSMGAAGAILKPFDIEEFVSAVRRALDPERSAAG